MCCRRFWKSVVPFSFAFTLSCLTVNLYGQNIPALRKKERIKPSVDSCYAGSGYGMSGPGDIGNISLIRGSSPVGSSETGKKTLKYDTVNNKSPKIYPPGTTPLQITSKPMAKYTEEARSNCVEGKVRLRITFFADGKVGNLKVIKGLNHGLSEQAVEAAKRIKFQPAIKRGKPITVIKFIDYSFTIY